MREEQKSKPTKKKLSEADYSGILHLTAPHSDISLGISSFLSTHDYNQVKKIDKNHYRHAAKKTASREETLKSLFNLTLQEYNNIPAEIKPHLELILPVIKNIYRDFNQEEKNALGNKPYAVLLDLFCKGLLSREFTEICKNTPALAYKVMDIPALKNLLPKNEIQSNFVPQNFRPNFRSRLLGAGLGFGIATLKAIRHGLEVARNFAGSLAISAVFLGVGYGINHFFIGVFPMPTSIPEFFTTFWPLWMPVAILTFFSIFLTEADTANRANRERIATGEIPAQGLISGLANFLGDSFNAVFALFSDTYFGYKLGHRKILDHGNFSHLITVKSSRSSLGAKLSFIHESIVPPTVATIANEFKFKYGKTLDNLKTKESKQEDSPDNPAPRSYSDLNAQMGGSVTSSSAFKPTDIEMTTYSSASASTPLLKATLRRNYARLDDEDSTSFPVFGFGRSDD
jgi:hypothetical protein